MMETELTALPPVHAADHDDRALNILSELDRPDFLLAVNDAEAAAVDAHRVRDAMLLWAKRLLPYLDRDPEMTVAQALQCYRRAQAGDL